MYRRIARLTLVGKNCRGLLAYRIDLKGGIREAIDIDVAGFGVAATQVVGYGEGDGSGAAGWKDE
ncbi:MAG: hypothetical protein OHK0039_18120 [Bacteroidia bacterium]